MGTVKTAISIQESLYKELDSLAHKLRTSRSRLFSVAVREFLERRRNRQLLRDINAAYNEPLDKNEKKMLEAGSAVARDLLKGEW